jgi:hypothetical protein
MAGRKGEARALVALGYLTLLLCFGLRVVHWVVLPSEGRIWLSGSLSQDSGGELIDKSLVDEAMRPCDGIQQILSKVGAERDFCIRISRKV